MRRSHVVTALVALAAGLTASASVRRLVDRRRPVTAESPAVSAPAPVPASAADVVAEPLSDRGGEVLRFARRVKAVPVLQPPAGPARCGDSGGRTKAGAPCGARATSGSRCHHHRLAV